LIRHPDRLCIWAGDAVRPVFGQLLLRTAYKVGELKIEALRAKAHAALGEGFDLRRFHNVVIDGGSVPLSVLEADADAWIAAERKGGKK